MTTTANAMLENCCDPCPSCWGGCKNDCPVNIQSTNPDCLRVDTSECWVIKLEPSCPKPTYVKAWDNVVVEEETPPSDCYIDWASCWVKGWWRINATDEKVKACRSDTTSGYLDEKLIEWDWIIISHIWCDWNTNSKLKISIDDDYFPDPVEIPEITVTNDSEWVTLSVSWKDKHHLTITDNVATTYDNMCCIWFEANQDYSVRINQQWNSETPTFVRLWTIYTGNKDMASAWWIKILKEWYYRIYWQLTVQNNSASTDDDYFFNLGRWFIHITPWVSRPNLWQNILLSTAKHWAYARQVLLKGWSDIDISDWWEISSWSWSWQNASWFDWPWMTFNIDCMVDLYEGDIITMWYRPQSDIPESRWNACSFRFVWQNDSSTEYDALFWWTVLWVHMLAPKLFQSSASNKVYARI